MWALFVGMRLITDDGYKSLKNTHGQCRLILRLNAGQKRNRLVHIIDVTRRENHCCTPGTGSVYSIALDAVPFLDCLNSSQRLKHC
jgi:hypothetical protein